MGTAVVSGSASGIGKCIANRLRAQGFDIIGIDLANAEVEADLSVPNGRQAAIDGALELAGGTIDRLVLAAGLGGHLLDGALVVRVNYYGAITLLDGFKEALAAADDPRAVVISSNSSQLGTDPNSPIIKALLDGTEEEAIAAVGDLPASGTYMLSKQAVARAVRRRAAEWGAAGIRLNAIAPGTTETPMFRGAADHPEIGKAVDAIPIPQGRVATPDEIAAVIEFLLGDDAAYMQGSVIYVDGGTDAQLRPDAY